MLTMECELNITKCVRSANYYCNEFLAASSLYYSEFQPKTQPEDLNLSVVCCPSSREAASKLSHNLYFHVHISISESAVPLSYRESDCSIL